MKDVLYIPFIMFRPIDEYGYADLFIEKIRNFSTPGGIEILNVEYIDDPIVEQILKQLISLNSKPGDQFNNVVSNDNYVIQIEIESEMQIHFSQMVWFEDQIIQLIDEHFRFVGLYYFYLVDEGSTFKNCNIAKTRPNDEYELIINDTDDDMSFVNSAAPFLAHYWYHNDEVSISEAFPAETAKYLLLFDF